MTLAPSVNDVDRSVQVVEPPVACLNRQSVGAGNVPGGGGGGGVEPARCVSVALVPAIVSVAVRSAPVFAATVNWTVPFPLPLGP